MAKNDDPRTFRPKTNFIKELFQKASHIYRAFHGFGQAKFAHGGSILGSRKFSQLPQLPLKTMLNLKLVRIDLEIILVH